MKMVASPLEQPRRSYICDECVRLSASILADDGTDLELPPRPSFRLRLARRIAGLHRIAIIEKHTK
jgi:ClpX C4-type zinc finger